MMLRLSNGLYHMISSRVAPILVVALGQFVAPAVWHKLLRFSLPLQARPFSLHENWIALYNDPN